MNRIRTTFEVIEAQQGTSKQEIDKAKRVFRKMRKLGHVNNHTFVVLRFFDSNYKIWCQYQGPNGENIEKIIIKN